MLHFVESWAEVITSKTIQKYIVEFTHSKSNCEDIDYIATIQGGHLGINKTTEKISSRYYWPNIKEDVTSFIHTCEKCQRVNKSMLMKTHIELHLISIPTKIFSQVGINLMSLTESEGFDEDGGYKYLISAQCYFSKYVELGALKKKAEEVSKWIYNQIIHRYGVTDIHITDNSSEFANNLSKEMYKKLGVNLRLTTPYHPQANGMIEWTNRTTSQMILKMLHKNNKQQDWVNYLPTVGFALWTSIHKSTNYEPLALLLGRKLKIPVECHDYGDEIQNVIDAPDISEEKKNNMIEGFQKEHFAALLAKKHEIFGEVKSNIDKNQKCQKHYFDIQNEMPNNVVKKGDIVFLEKQKDKTRKGGKLASRYFESTYTVVNIHSNANLILKNMDTNEILKTPVPPSHIKKYLKRKLQDEFMDTQDSEVNIEVKMEDYLDIMSGVNEKDDSSQILTTKCNDDGIATSSEANCKQALTANKQVKKDDSPEISTTKCNDNADKEDEESKRNMDTMCKSQKHEVSDSNSMLSDDDDFLVVATKVTPPQPAVFSPLTAGTQVEVRPLLNILHFAIPKVQFFGMGRLLKPFVHAKTLKIAGDGNCLFWAINYGISNMELYHTHVRREICNFIETHDKDMKPFFKKGQGKKYIEGSQM